MLKESGVPTPVYNGEDEWPIVAADWANPNVTISNWEHKGKSSFWEAGDVIAIKFDTENASGHCGIAVSGTHTRLVAAGTNHVYETTNDNTLICGEASVRRYIGPGA